MLKIYHNPQCSKSRAGLQLLKDSGEDFQIINYLKNAPSDQEIKNILFLLNISAEELVRKNEAIWKEHYKGKALTEAEIIQIMIENPKLIERPIVVRNGKAVIGRPTENIQILLNEK